MSLSSVSFGSAPVGATSPVSKGKAASSSRDEGALTSFGMTLQGMTDKANAQALRERGESGGGIGGEFGGAAHERSRRAQAGG